MDKFSQNCNPPISTSESSLNHAALPENGQRINSVSNLPEMTATSGHHGGNSVVRLAQQPSQQSHVSPNHQHYHHSSGGQSVSSLNSSNRGSSGVQMTYSSVGNTGSSSSQVVSTSTATSTASVRSHGQMYSMAPQNQPSHQGLQQQHVSYQQPTHSQHQRQSLQQQLQGQAQGSWAVPNPLGTAASAASSSSSLTAPHYQNQNPIIHQQQQQQHQHHHSRPQNIASRGGVHVPVLAMQQSTQSGTYQHQQEQLQQQQRKSMGYGHVGNQVKQQQLQNQTRNTIQDKQIHLQQGQHHHHTGQMTQHQSTFQDQQQKLQQQQQQLQQLQQRQKQLTEQQKQIHYQNQHRQQQLQQQQQQPSTQNQYVSQSQQQNQPYRQQPRQEGQLRSKTKIILSNAAKNALGKAIWSSIRSPTGEIEPTLLQAAMATGLPRNAILNAARVARERERQKRKLRQEQQMMQQGMASTSSQPIHNQQQDLLLKHQEQIKQRQHQIQMQQQQKQQHYQQQQAGAQHQHRPRSPYNAQSNTLQAQSHPTSGQNVDQTYTQPNQQSSHHQQTSRQPYAASSSSHIQQNYQTQGLQQSQKQQLQQQQQQQQQKRPTNHTSPQPRSSPVDSSTTQKAVPKTAQLGSKSIGKTLGSLAKAKQQAVAAQQALANKTEQIKAEERSKWKRVHQGIFVMQKGKFLSPQHTVSAVVRSKCQTPVLNLMPEAPTKKLSPEVLSQAAQIQRLLLQQRQLHSNKRTGSALLDADKFKRIKMEPKKYGKALDRAARKSRQLAVDTLNKQYKEFAKLISSHQSDFFKFHRQKKADAAKIARAIRDNLDKEEKRKEKESVAAERARLAALKANDMDAYSKLLEETKNERLKFLMDKTEKHFSQISMNLLQERNTGKDGSVAAAGGTSSYYASAHLKKEEVRQPSILVGGDLKEYQLSGLQWMVSLYNNKLNGILADEMGLGKTIQAISLIAYLMEFKNNLGPFLVIVPLSTLSNWVGEFQKWCPSAHLICYKGIPAQRKEIYKDQVKNGNFNVLLTTYEYVIKDKASLRKITWQYAIVDEGHRMKNAASKFAKTLSSQYETKYRILLTGTPLMNDLSELWSLLNFLLPTIFNSVDTFDQWFYKPFAQFGNSVNNGAEEETNFLSTEERMFIIHRLHEMLRPFMLRRVKSEVLDQLPEKVEKVLRCELSSWQKELYKQISRKVAVENNLLGDSPTEPQPISRGLNNAVMQLRKVCNHPFLFSPEGYHINENLIRSSAKVELLDRMLPKLKAAGHRVLIFTQMTAVMTILEDYFSYRGYLSLRLDGSTPAEEREKRMYKFNSPDSPYFIFLLSTRAGGLGLNLTSANTVIIFDSDWNPMMDLQAQDRAHRIGQRSDVSVFRLVTNSPVEEKILSRASEKLNMSELVVEAGKFDKSSVENDNSLERKRLMEVLLTDFETNANKNDTTAVKAEDKTSILTGSDDGSIDGDDDEENSADKEEDLNELISNNENDYQLYKSLDSRPRDPNAVDTTLYTSDADVPDWIKYPSGKKETPLRVTVGGIPNSGPRKRKEVMYDDGLTDKQFMRMMDKQYDSSLSVRETEKVVQGKNSPAGSGRNTSIVNISSDLTDWTFRKLISCTKSVIALKDASKRRLCDIFLDKPSAEQFPDYYEIIQKPIAINDILRKLRGKLYSNIREYRDDWKVMFANAKQFNGEDSWVVEDGKAIEKELERVLKKNGFIEEAVQPKTSPKPKKKFVIKLSLKGLKAKEASLESSQEGPTMDFVSDTTAVTKPAKKKRKKSKSS